MVTPFETYLEKRLGPFSGYLKKKEVLENVTKQLTPAIQAYVKNKIKPTLTPEQISELVISEITKRPSIEKTIRQEIIKPTVTIKETRIKEDKDLRKEIETLKKELEIFKQILPLGGSGVLGLPGFEGQSGKILSNDGSKPTWIAASTGGSSSDTYTPTNVTTDRSFDATSTSMDELANVLGSLIASLQGAGIVQ